MKYKKSWRKLLNSSRVKKSSSLIKLVGGTGSGYVDSREEFVRDYDRSIFSTPVKRLQDKAQVFPLEECDSVRTRLTHSLEVSCVAKGLAWRIANWLSKNGDISKCDMRGIEYIAATCGLIHDLGNPPFGHAGEYAIQGWFEANKKSVRANLGKEPI